MTETIKIIVAFPYKLFVHTFTLPAARSYVHYRVKGQKLFLFGITKKYENHGQLLDQCLAKMKRRSTITKAQAVAIRDGILNQL